VKDSLCRSLAQEKVKIPLSGATLLYTRHGGEGDLTETWKPELFMDPASHTRED